MSTGHYEPVPPASSGLSFTQGFLLGQLSVALFLAAFIKFFIFGEPPSYESRHSSSSSGGAQLSTLSPTHKRTVSFTPHASTSPGLASGSRQRGASGSSAHPPSHAATQHVVRPPRPLTAAAILGKAYYHVSAHQPESLDWFNVLVGQALAQLRADAAADGAVLASLTAVLNGAHKPDFLERVAVTEIALGDEFPIFSNCRVHPVQDGEDDEAGGTTATTGGGGGGGGGGGRLQAMMDVDLSDLITLGVETTLVLNYPRPRCAVLPVALSVSVVRFSGTLAISFLPASTPAAAAASSVPEDPFTSSSSSSSSPPPLPNRTPTTLAFSFQPTYTLSLSTRSLLGARSRLQDVPKIAQLVEARLRTWFEERCVAPRRQQIVIPSLWPRMKNVVAKPGGSGGGSAGAAAGSGTGTGSTGAGGPAAGLGPAGLGAAGGPPLEQLPPQAPRDLRAEAMRELLEEERRREQARQRPWEGLRWRGAATAAAAGGRSLSDFGAAWAGYAAPEQGGARGGAQTTTQAEREREDGRVAADEERLAAEEERLAAEERRGRGYPGFDMPGSMPGGLAS